MVYETILDISAGIRYAEKWAFSRNPAYYDFENDGGDCTNFISQCIYAEGAAMNFTPDIGWYFNSSYDRAAAWSGVESFYRFITNNRGAGPFGKIVTLSETAAGDVIQLGRNGRYYHSLYVLEIRNGMPFIAAHSENALYRPLSSYSYGEIRCIHIAGQRR